MRVRVLALLIFWGGWNEARPQGPVAQRAAAFQVALIRPSAPDEPQRIQIVGHRFSTSGTTLVEILKYAYGIHASQVTGGPEWLGTQKFDVLADPETEARPTSDQMKRMVQELVAERFGLRFHHAGKALPVFAITVGKAGPKLTKSSRDEPDGIPSVGFTPPGTLGARNATMADFATFLQRFVLDRPVVDQTAVTGRYDIDLSWTPEELQASGAEHGKVDVAGAPPGLFTAIQEQLGLKLNATRAVIDVFVVDRVEQPSAN